MKAAFPDNIPAAQSIIDAIFGENKYTVIDVKCQVEVSPLRNRGVRLDILMRDLAGRRFNVEFQRDEMPADPHRARLNASLLDSNIMRKGEKPQGMPDRYVIFITEEDYWHAGRAKYVFRSMEEELHIPFGDGSYFVYVNGAYTGKDPIGDLVHDLREPDPSKMRIPALRNTANHLKNTIGGKATVVSAMKEYYRQGQQQAVLDYAALVIGKMIAKWKAKGVSHNDALQQALEVFTTEEYEEYITDIFEDLWYEE